MGFVLGLHGPALAGKDTVADFLIENRGWDAKLSFAKNLKEMCKAVFNLTDHDVYSQEGKKTFFPEPRTFTDRNLGSIMYWMVRTHKDAAIPHTAMTQVKSLVGKQLVNPREVLQFVGTDICRTLIPTYHVDVLLKAVADSPTSRFLVTDVRFPNEADLIVDELGGAVALISRPSASADNINTEHASETSMRSWPGFLGTINNDKDGLSYLFETVDAFMEDTGLCQTLSLNEKKGPSSLMEETEGRSATGTK